MSGYQPWRQRCACRVCYLSAHVAEDGAAAVLHLLDEVGHDFKRFVSFVRQALQTQHVHLLAVAHAVDLALELLNSAINLTFGGVATHTAVED